MTSLTEFLSAHNYRRVPFKISKTQHLLVNARINGVRGHFILDTGASNTCVDFSYAEYFQLTAEATDTRAAGAGATDMHTQIAFGNSLQMGRWKINNSPIILFDLTHVNAALLGFNAKAVHGIIGADILLQGKAVIDYEGKQFFLKRV